MATEAGHADIVKYFVENGADVNAKDPVVKIDIYNITYL